MPRTPQDVGCGRRRARKGVRQAASRRGENAAVAREVPRRTQNHRHLSRLLKASGGAEGDVWECRVGRCDIHRPAPRPSVDRAHGGISLHLEARPHRRECCGHELGMVEERNRRGGRESDGRAAGSQRPVPHDVRRVGPVARRGAGGASEHGRSCRQTRAP